MMILEWQNLSISLEADTAYFINPNILVEEGTFYDFSFVCYRGCPNPDKQIDRQPHRSTDRKKIMIENDFSPRSRHFSKQRENVRGRKFNTRLARQAVFACFQKY